MLFVAKVLYLLELDSGDKQSERKDLAEEAAVGSGVAQEEAEQEARAGEKADSDEEQNEEGKEEQASKPATLLWLIQKLSRIAKLEAAYSPRNLLKVQ